MVSKNLRKLFLFSIPLFIAHGIEEYITGFYTFDPLLFGHLGSLSKPLYILSKIALIAVALTVYLFILDKKFAFIVAILWGLLLAFEIEHLYRAVSLHMYTSGLFTGILLVILGIFYWKELIRIWSQK